MFHTDPPDIIQQEQYLQDKKQQQHQQQRQKQHHGQGKSKRRTASPMKKHPLKNFRKTQQGVQNTTTTTTTTPNNHPNAFRLRKGLPTHVLDNRPPLSLVLLSTNGAPLKTVDLSYWDLHCNKTKQQRRQPKGFKGGSNDDPTLHTTFDLPAALRRYSSHHVLSLDLSTTAIQSHALSMLHTLVVLKEIRLNDCPCLNTETMRHLARCKVLKQVSLNNSANAVGMPEMLPLLSYLYSHGRHVEELNLSQTNLSDEALDSIASLAVDLRCLTVDHNPTITHVGVQQGKKWSGRRKKWVPRYFDIV
jgi:hypothetical protein